MTINSKPAPICPICEAGGLACVFSYDRPPVGETRFSIHRNQPYFRQVLECPICHHMVSLVSLDLENLYRTDYAESTYGRAGIEDTYQRIISLPPEKSDNAGRVERLNRWVASKMSTAEDSRHLLDVGAGLGVFIAAMQKKGWTCTAVEPNPLLAEHIRERIGCGLFNLDFMTLEPKRRYGVVAFNKVLEHVAEPVEMLRRSLRFLNPHGAVYIELPDGETAKARGPEREEFFIEHQHIFSKASFSKLASRAGLKILQGTRLHEPSGKFTLAALAVPQNSEASSTCGLQSYEKIRDLHL